VTTHPGQNFGEVQAVDGTKAIEPMDARYNALILDVGEAA